MKIKNKKKEGFMPDFLDKLKGICDVHITNSQKAKESTLAAMRETLHEELKNLLSNATNIPAETKNVVIKFLNFKTSTSNVSQKRYLVTKILIYADNSLIQQKEIRLTEASYHTISYYGDISILTTKLIYPSFTIKMEDVFEGLDISSEGEVILKS